MDLTPGEDQKRSDKDAVIHGLHALVAAREWAGEHGHPQPDDRMLRKYGAALLRDVADLIDRGPAIPLPPSIFSTLVRERADDLGGE